MQCGEPGFDALAVHAEVGSTIDAAGIDDQVAAAGAVFQNLDHDQVGEIKQCTAGDIVNLKLIGIQRRLISARLVTCDVLNKRQQSIDGDFVMRRDNVGARGKSFRRGQSGIWT